MTLLSRRKHQTTQRSTLASKGDKPDAVGQAAPTLLRDTLSVPLADAGFGATKQSTLFTACLTMLLLIAMTATAAASDGPPPKRTGWKASLQRSTHVRTEKPTWKSDRYQRSRSTAVSRVRQVSGEFESSETDSRGTRSVLTRRGSSSHNRSGSSTSRKIDWRPDRTRGTEHRSASRRDEETRVAQNPSGTSSTLDDLFGITKPSDDDAGQIPPADTPTDPMLDTAPAREPSDTLPPSGATDSAFDPPTAAPMDEPMNTPPPMDDAAQPDPFDSEPPTRSSEPAPLFDKTDSQPMPKKEEQDPFKDDPRGAADKKSDPGKRLGPVDRDDAPRFEPREGFDADSEEDCQKALDRLKAQRLDQITLNISAAGQLGSDVPYECTLGRGEFSPRSWSEITYMWKASGLCHKPLYFEDESLERYGHSWGPYTQPFVSGAHFFGTLPILPYKMGLRTPNECVYVLGHYRPGNCAPYFINPIPFTWRAALFEAGAAVGAAAIIP